MLRGRPRKAMGLRRVIVEEPSPGDLPTSRSRSRVITENNHDGPTQATAGDGQHRAYTLGADFALDSDLEFHDISLHRHRDTHGPSSPLLGQRGKRLNTTAD